jgi:hypothetical protein
MGTIYLTPLMLRCRILFMVNTLTVNGRTVAVLNTLSCGPGCQPHTYELSGGSYVYEIAGSWWLQERGQSKREVTVGR